MAKISARGATQVAKVEGKTAGGLRVVLVLRSDGAVLRKVPDIDSTYRLAGKFRGPLNGRGDLIEYGTRRFGDDLS